jgi:hypothetical protein
MPGFLTALQLPQLDTIWSQLLPSSVYRPACLSVCLYAHSSVWTCVVPHLTRGRLTGGRCVLLLEGGYDLLGLREGASESIRGLLGLGPECLEAAVAPEPEPMEAVSRLIDEIRRIHGLE